MFLSKWHVKNIVFFPVIQIYSLCLSPEHALAMWISKRKLFSPDVLFLYVLKKKENSDHS